MTTNEAVNRVKTEILKGESPDIAIYRVTKDGAKLSEIDPIIQQWLLGVKTAFQAYL